MTAVARILIDGHPLLIGDVLLSGPPVPGKEVFIPTSGINLSNPSTGSTPKRLHQKITVVADYLALGWCGRFEIAQDLVSDLRVLSSATRATYLYSFS